MTRNEKRILRSAIKAVAHHNSNVWWELKRQIFEGGYSPYYPAKDDLDGPAEEVVAGLPSDVKDSLLSEWRRARHGQAEWPDSEILDSYARMIVSEVVERARVAAYRTIHW